MSKKVKFASVEEETEFLEEFDTEIGAEFEGNVENDLDLDTIRARTKSRSVKNIDEADDDEEEDEEEQPGKAKDSQMNWDSDEDKEDNEIEGEEDKEAFASAQEDEDDKSVPLEPFNLKVDREEGSFDADGFFVRNVDEDADQDRWLSNLTNSDISKARRAHEKVEAERRAAQEAREEEAKKISSREAYKELLKLMKPGETVLMAIRAKSKPKHGAEASTAPRPPLNKNRLKKLQANQSGSTASDQSPNSADSVHQLNRLTELADLLMNRGNYSVYEETFEEISLKLSQIN